MDDKEKNVEDSLEGQANETGINSDEIRILKESMMEIGDLSTNTLPIVCCQHFDNENRTELHPAILFRTLKSVYQFGVGNEKALEQNLVFHGNNARIGGVLFGLLLAGLIESHDSDNDSRLENLTLTAAGEAMMKKLYSENELLQETCAVCQIQGSCSVYTLFTQ